MNTDVNGVSTCLKGEERFEHHYSKAHRRWQIQYDYRTPGGELFSTIARTISEARQKRDQWLKEKK